MSSDGEIGALQSYAGECFLSALCHSANRLVGQAPASASELFQLCSRIKRVDLKLQEIRDIYHGSGLPTPDQTEERLSELLEAVVFLVFKYPTLNSQCVQEALKSLTCRVRDSTTPVGASEGRKRFSEIFRDLDALEINIGNETVEMLLGDTSLSDSNPQHDEEEPLISNPLLLNRASYEKDGAVVSAEEADEVLIHSEGGVESALNYAKRWCKYVRELLGYMEKRLGYESEFAKNAIRLSESARCNISQQPCMPLQDVYLLLMDHETHMANSATNTVAHLQMKKYYQPLSAKKTEIEKWRKEFREQWQREQKRMTDALSSLRKSRQLYIQRCEELEKAKQLSAKVEEEQTMTTQPGSAHKQLERRRRFREEAQTKALEAEAAYRSCVSEANLRCQQQEMVRMRIISHIRKLIHQGDQVLKEVTLNLLRMKRTQCESFPSGYENLLETCDPYEAGDRYLQFILTLPKKHTETEKYIFQEYVPTGQRSSPGGRRKNAVQLVRVSSSLSDLHLKPEDQAAKLSPGERGSWGNKYFNSDSDTMGGGSEVRTQESPSDSPGHDARKVIKASSTGTVSSDDLDERDSNQTDDVDSTDATSENGVPPQSPDKAAYLSPAAQSHRLRRTRVPSKCKECEGFMVSGVECEECYLTCHRKCLESLIIKCGHKKLPSKVPLFGIDFSQFPRYFPEEVPFIIVKCTSEIELRALGKQGLYRVSGAKARVEKLLQAFENGRDLVDLSGHSPHDITSSLKQFLKQLPDSVVPYQLYKEFIEFSREFQDDKKGTEESHDHIQRMKDILCRLPATNYNTLRHLTAHLYRVSQRYDENMMNPNNLGIIFGPTLIRPSPGQDVTMTCLIDSGYQAQAVEFLIKNYEKIFGMDDLPSCRHQLSGEEQPEAEISGSEAARGSLVSEPCMKEGHPSAVSSETDGRDQDGLNQLVQEEPGFKNEMYSRDHFSRLPVRSGRAEQRSSQELRSDEIIDE